MNAFDRATSPGVLQGLGDPERWGAHGEVSLLVPIGAGTYTHTGNQLIRVQVPDLLARGWLVSCLLSAQGIDPNALDPDRPDYFLEITSGVGVTSYTARLDVGRLATAGPWVATLNSAAQLVAGFAQMPTPVPATAMAIRPVVSVRHAGAVVADHTVRVSFDISVCPVSLA